MLISRIIVRWPTVKLTGLSSDTEVEAKKNKAVKEIEVDERSSSFPRHGGHEHIRGMVKKRWNAMRWLCSGQPLPPGLLWGHTLKGFSRAAKAFPAALHKSQLPQLVFIIVIMARQQLFTENTVTAVLPVMQNPTLVTLAC